MKLGLVFLLLLGFYLNSISAPVDCTEHVNVLEIGFPKTNCKDMYVCKTDCKEIYPNCATVYHLEYHESDMVETIPFKNLYFNLLAGKNNYSREAFKRACVYNEFSTIPTKLIISLSKRAKNYLSLFNLPQNSRSKLEKILLYYVWTYQFFYKPSRFSNDQFFKKEAKKMVDFIVRRMPYYKKQIATFNVDEKSIYNIIKDTLDQEFINFVKNNRRDKSYNNPVYGYLIQIAIFIGRLYKGEYFSVPTHIIIDKWVDMIVSLKKQCELNKKEFDVQYTLDADAKLMEKTPNYIFGDSQSFKKGKEENSKEYQSFLRIRNVVFSRISGSYKNVRFCYCNTLVGFYEEKEKELIAKGEDTKELIQERNQKKKQIRISCKKECYRRGAFRDKYDYEKKLQRESFRNIELEKKSNKN